MKNSFQCTPKICVYFTTLCIYSLNDLLYGIYLKNADLSRCINQFVRRMQIYYLCCRYLRKGNMVLRTRTGNSIGSALIYTSVIQDRIPAMSCEVLYFSMMFRYVLEEHRFLIRVCHISDVAVKL